MDFKGLLKVHWVNSLSKLHCYLTKGFEGGGVPITKPRAIVVGRSERENKNFAGMRLTKELIGGILSAPLKFIGSIPLLNYTVI